MPSTQTTDPNPLPKEQTVLVYDLGGGTFDVTLVKLAPKRFESIARHVAFYPSKVDQCYIDDEPVQAQAGDFYGGWITSQIVGPFKGGPGTWGW